MRTSSREVSRIRFKMLSFWIQIGQTVPLSFSKRKSLKVALEITWIMRAIELDQSVPKHLTVSSSALYRLIN